ncbi:HNH endonuclease [Arthrobacter phage Nancia]|uniref:HNH endonuclease n=5 Tax=Korravirus TaxID=1982076 RepID=A0A3G8FVV4_9CAUD|nr:HNH endonuclease [Arthrobacter phage BigMack]AZF98302.1 HNH endonuclease [Arthrobacter phage Bodacious]AZS07029.1 HNH endonuclease [Arthrobacter phage ChewChew]AZS07254.1 HNH endonuclease [Arthrobacter phage CristinaYang]AZS09133.1 HNH endonuclease [Arthrobacter phage Nancia]QHB47217.1 HNH endonuclease [Arthrobacter phage AppleCider]
MITCIACGEEHPKEHYYQSRKGSIIRRCRDCRNARTREARRKVREKVVLHYGGVCVCCGEDRMVFLNIDHIDGGGTAEIKKLGPNLAWRLHMAGMPPGYQILCWNCNNAKHLLGSLEACPHWNK